jgi:creatinine amidohydrolase/Fe(II)-dependent formamide hydrolase-like protein
MRNPGDPAYDPPASEGMGGAPHHRALQLAWLLQHSNLLWDHRTVKRKVVLLPVGSLEDRPFGPMQSDTLLATLTAVKASFSATNCLVAPPIAYGYSPTHRMKVEVKPSVLMRFLESVIAGFKLLGARKVVVVDGHYGHRDYVRTASYHYGARYINVWEVIIDFKKAYSFKEQLSLEKEIIKDLMKGVWPEELDKVVDKVKGECL